MDISFFLIFFVKKISLQMKVCIFILLLSLFFSCSKEDSIGERFVLDNGDVIYVDNEVRNYATEVSFVNTMLADYGQDGAVGKRNGIQQGMKLQKDSLYGGGRIDLYAWEKASFGEWGEVYGLTTGKIYLVATAVVHQSIPANGLQAIVPSSYASNEHDSIGFVPNSVDRGFSVTHSNVVGFIGCCTVLKYIRCDVEREKVDWFYPIGDTKKLKWKYTIVSLNNDWI